MKQTLHAYRNVVSGDVFVFAAERPDLAARANFEDADLDDVPEGIKEAALREAAAAASIGQLGKHDDDEDSAPAGVAVTGGDPAAGVFQVAVSGKPAADGVLSRNIVKAKKSVAEHQEDARADAEALATHGVLASQLHTDGDVTPIEVAGGAAVDIVNPTPVGDVDNSEVAKKAAAAGKRRTGAGAGSHRTHPAPSGPSAPPA